MLQCANSRGQDVRAVYSDCSLNRWKTNLTPSDYNVGLAERAKSQQDQSVRFKPGSTAMKIGIG